MLRLYTTALTALALLALAGPAQAAVAPPFAPPPTLTGETFFEDFSATQPRLIATCSSSDVSTITFHTFGVAAGPYPGTYDEQGTVRIGVQTSPPLPAAPGVPSTQGFSVGPVLSFDSQFEIQSAVGHVQGSKEVVVPLPTNMGACVDFATALTTGYLRDARAVVEYQATITTARGTFTDRGNATTFMQDYRATSVLTGTTLASVGVFNESFASTLVSPELAPTPPGSSPALLEGRGCGDINHEHVERDLCPA
jgi:hypothetical protein